jgi:glycerol-3-phosphate acyltransferase PlsY
MTERLICAVVGYLCGCFLTAEAVARAVSGKSAFAQGTGNPGTANIFRLFGPGPAAVTLLGDLAKTFLACLLCRFVFFPSLGGAAVMWAGVGAAAGHGFPFWHRFRGGRSVAVTCAYIVVFLPPWGLAADIAGMIIVFASGYLAFGALAIPALFVAPAFIFGGAEPGLLALAGTAVTAALHRDSIARISAGTESKIPRFNVIIAKLRRRR